MDEVKVLLECKGAFTTKSIFLFFGKNLVRGELALLNSGERFNNPT